MAIARNRRQYATTPLPTLRAGIDTAESREIFLAIYAEANNNWRQLVDIRFRLLALVPGASIIFAAVLADNVDGLPPASRLLAALLSGAGLAAVAGLWLYDRRNDELHDDLISRARKIEQELGLETGVFLGRRKSRSRFVTHGIGKAIVYLSAAAAWLLALAAIALAPGAASLPPMAAPVPAAAPAAPPD